MDEHVAVRRWLLCCIAAVFVAVFVGGITRLTESGLSITEWKPVSGVVPPLTTAGWDDAFEKFRQIPQARTTHARITMVQFKWIYWWEWFHRLAARAVGLIFALPFLWFVAKGKLPERYGMRLTWLPLLTLAQGALGWYMVQSGLEVRSSVSAYRLAAHLALALTILVIAVWTWADLNPKRESVKASVSWRWSTLGVVSFLAVTIVSGAFVAGLRGGEIFNEFPLMGGQLVPPGYSALSTWWINALENPVAAQFHHRVLAVLTGVASLVLAWRATPLTLGEYGAMAVRVLGLAIAVQFVLGIATILLAVPFALGVLHQLAGTVALTAGVLAVHALWVPIRAGRVSDTVAQPHRFAAVGVD
jgi:cytochrome c oxidase assembly protein subunit 15